MNTERLWPLCHECAATISDRVPPNERYVDMTARLLLGTCAQESGGEWERQRLPRLWDTDIGGFSKWQLEKGSIMESLRMLQARPQLLRRVTDFVFNDPLTPLTWTQEIPIRAVLWALCMEDNDRLGVVLCRLHYLRDPWPIPATLWSQAMYWKRVYNTVAGAGTEAEYVHSWNMLCAGLVPEWPS